MNKLDEIKRFAKFFWSHPAWDHREEKWLRISYLPSDYLLERDPTARKHLKDGKNERTVDALALEFEAKQIVGVNEKGWDSYYFLNTVPQDFIGSTKNDTVLERLFLPVDIDYRLPVPPEELCEELGLTPSAIIVSSEREFARYQIIFGVDPGEHPARDESDLNDLASRLGHAVGSCSVFDAKRIFRLPGTINWKGAKVNGHLEGASLSRIHSLNEGLVWGADDIAEALEKFEESKLSNELRLLGLSGKTTGSRGGASHGDPGLLPSWSESLAAAEKGEWSVKSGARHNALCFWGVQMCAARLPWEQLRRNLDTLRRHGFEQPYDELNDYKRLVSDVRKKWESIDSELDGFREPVEPSTIDAGGSAHIIHQDPNLVVEKTTVKAGKKKRGSPAPSRLVDPLVENNTSGGILRRDGEREPQAARSKRLAKTETNTASGAGDPKPRKKVEPIGDFAKRLSYQGEGETEAEWIDFLAKVLAAVNNYHRDKGNIYHISTALCERLAWAGATRGRYYSVPVYFEETRTWTMQANGNETQARLLVNDFFIMVSERIYEQREKVRPHPRVVAAVKGLKKPFYVFAAKGSFLTAVISDVVQRGAGIVVSEAARKIDRRVIAFQNGIFRLDTFDASPHLPWAERVRASWTANPEIPKGLKGVRRGLSWIDYDYALSCSVDIEAIAEKETTPLEAQMWDSFLEGAFPGDKGAGELLERIIGYCFLVDNPYQKYFYFEGKAGGGKGTTAELIMSLVGVGNAGRVQFDRILSDAWLGPLNGKTVVLIDEAENEDMKTHRKVTAELARVTGEDRVSARMLYGDAIEIHSTQKFILTTNRSLQTDDAAGQQSRRIVPVNFAHVPTGKIVPRFYAELIAAEGEAIASRGMLRLLECRQGDYGVSMFSQGLEESEAVSRGRERFEEATAGVRKFLGLILVNTETVARGGTGQFADENISRGLLRVLTEIWIRNQEHRRDLLRGLDNKIVADLERLGFKCSKEAASIPMPERAIAMGYPRKSRAALGVRIDAQKLVDVLDMSPEEIVSAVRRLTAGRRKEWFTAQSALGGMLFPQDLFLRIENEINWEDLEDEAESSKKSWQL